LFQRLGNFLGGDFAWTKSAFELFLIIFVGRKLRDDMGKSFMHLDRILNGFEDLGAQGGGATIPKEIAFPGHIKDGHGIPDTALTFGPDANAAAFVAEGFFRMVAGDA
jgi:hypothetical protein